MPLRSDAIDDFLDCFDERAPEIRAFPGCRHLELWRDADAPAVFTTHSHWNAPDALERYRDSDLFAHTWATLKPLFSARPQAHSYHVVRPAAELDRRAGRPPRRP